MSEPISRIEDALKQLGSEHEPPLGWEARVLAQVEDQRPMCPRRIWQLACPMVGVVAIAIALVFAGTAARARPFKLTFDTTHTGPRLRGDAPTVGDLVTATVSGGEPHRAIWIYRGTELIAACPGGERGERCEGTGDSQGVRFTLTTRGRYALIALSSSLPLPPPRGSYDADLAAVARLGAQVQVQVQVQKQHILVE
jgi:hypothetical protein